MPANQARDMTTPFKLKRAARGGRRVVAPLGRRATHPDSTSRGLACFRRSPRPLQKGAGLGVQNHIDRPGIVLHGNHGTQQSPRNVLIAQVVVRLLPSSAPSPVT